MNCDYLIIGGGVYGCALAWELARAGADVVLLEKTTIAAGSSGGSGARGVRSDRRDLREMALVRRAQELWPTLDERLGGPTGYQRLGGLRLIEKEYVGGSGGRVSLQAHAWMQNQAGIPTTILDRSELLALEPGISEIITHALHVPTDGIAPQGRTTVQLATAARRAGATLLENTPVNSLTWSGTRVTAVQTDLGEYRPQKAVVITANAGTSPLLGEAMNPVPSWFVVPQATFIEPQQPHGIRHLVNHESRPLSLKAGPNGTVQISGGHRGRWNPKTNSIEVDESAVPAALAHAAAVYPSLAGARILSTEAGGPEACSPDGIPVIDLVPGSENVYLASHWTAHGFALFPAVVEALGSWVLNGEKPDILTPFAVSRFYARAA
jgi:sarcosine oxidase subunit beta